MRRCPVLKQRTGGRESPIPPARRSAWGACASVTATAARGASPGRLRAACHASRVRSEPPHYALLCANTGVVCRAETRPAGSRRSGLPPLQKRTWGSLRLQWLRVPPVNTASREHDYTGALLGWRCTSADAVFPEPMRSLAGAGNGTAWGERTGDRGLPGT